MTNRIKKTFENLQLNNKNGIILYLTTGIPNNETTAELALELFNSGAEKAIKIEIIKVTKEIINAIYLTKLSKYPGVIKIKVAPINGNNIVNIRIFSLIKSIINYPSQNCPSKN